MAVDAFLKLDGIDGESQDKEHKGEIDILSLVLGRCFYRIFQFGRRRCLGQGKLSRYHLDEVLR